MEKNLNWAKLDCLRLYFGQMLQIMAHAVTDRPCCYESVRSIRRRRLWAALVLLVLNASFVPSSFAQPADAGKHPVDNLQEIYNTAQHLQSAGDLGRAADAYRSFLLNTLWHLAEDHLHAGDYAGGAKLFEEAIAIEPQDAAPSLYLAYAQAALSARDIPKAKSLAETLVASSPKDPDARLVLGEALLQADENRDARKQLEAAVALDPNYKNGLALATADLALADTKSASTVFGEMSASFGNNAKLHLDIGKAYGESGFPGLAITEFKKAIALDPHLPEAHYCLGASYMLSRGQEDFPEAAKEFRLELARNPDDHFTLAQLGYIAFTERRFAEAETDLKRAATLDPRNPDNALLLGQVYMQLNRPADAERELRQAIALTMDLSRNHYQVQRAHFLLGRLLVQAGHADAAKREMQISASLLKQNMLRDQAKLKGTLMGDAAGIAPFQPLPDAIPINDNAKKELEQFTARAAPAIADSYNNLGAIAAGAGEFATATGYFENTAKWNPSLEGLDYNWGRAAFSGRLYAQAVPPLARYVAAHPHELGARRVLGVSYFMIHDYAAVVRTLGPIESSLAATPQLANMYAQSLALASPEKKGPNGQP